jgi:signal transduction histidine kinase/CHASE1-domain containing sensor protein/CheY-like chemotaxis protein
MRSWKKPMEVSMKNDEKAFHTQLLAKKLMPYVVLAILLSLSVAAGLFFKNLYIERAQQRFDEYITEKTSSIVDRLGKYKMILQGGVGLFMASEHVSRAQWRAYVENSQIRTLYPGVQGMGFSKVIQPPELIDHIRSIRAGGFPDYTVWPEGNRDEYTAIIYLVPFNDDNQSAFGYDMFSDPVRRAAMTRTRDTGEVSLSGRVTLVQETNQDIQPGFLIYVPVYRDDVTLHSPEERRAAIQGYVFAPFRMDVLMEDIFPKNDHKIDFKLYEGPDIVPAALIFASHGSPGSQDETHRPMFFASQTLDLYGHQWTLAIGTSPFFEAEVDFYIPKIILCSGVIISLLIFFLLKTVGDSARRAQFLAIQMTLELHRTSELLSISQRLAKIGGWELDVKTQRVTWTEEIFRMHEVDPSHTPDLDTSITFYTPESQPIITAAVQAAIDTGKSFDLELQLITSSGRTLWVRTIGEAERLDGRTVRLIGTFQDISAEKQSEQDHIVMLAAESANRQKSLFLSNMSHEIRTPMNAIMGFAQVLDRDPSLTPGQKKQIRIINRSSQHLLRLIDDILDISRIESGRIRLNPIVFGLEDFLDDVENMFQSRAEAKGLTLIVERDAGLSGWVRGDEGKLRQVLVNLLGNAVKFTESGGVCLRARSEPAAKHTGKGKKPLRLVFEVEDSGPGIAESEQERIFHAFEQVASERIIQGTGLGLSISLRLVKIMGGTLTVESVVGKGSCFGFSVLCEPAEAIQKSEAPELPEVVGLEPGSGPWRVLVVDDVLSNRALLHALLLSLGFEVQEAENGAEAIEIFEAWAPHAVLMDMRMPVMDGYEATRRIKATDKGRTTPVIAVTASVFMGREEEVMATGVSAFLRKPFRPEELYETLGEYLDLRYVYADEPSEAPQQPRTVALTPEALAALPRDLVQDMAEAVAEGDMNLLTELIHQVEDLDESAARGLKTLADQYDYTKLNELLG